MLTAQLDFKRKCTPMYLLERFNLIYYPEYRASEPEKLRPHLLRSSRLLDVTDEQKIEFDKLVAEYS